MRSTEPGGDAVGRWEVGWHSDALGRHMELLWYGHAGRPMIWFPSYRGRYHDPEGFGLLEGARTALESGRLRIACVDSVDAEALAADHLPPAERLARHDAYDRYLAAEVVPWVRGTVGHDTKVGTLGISFGAYHAVNFGFRHPELVDKVVGLSGMYDVAELLDGHWDELAHHHSPLASVAYMDADWIGRLSALDICIVSGEEDYLAPAARALIEVLARQHIPHRGDIWSAPSGHDWGWWRRQVTHYVP